MEIIDTLSYYIAFYGIIAIIIFLIIRSKKKKKKIKQQIIELQNQIHLQQNQLNIKQNEAYLIFPYKKQELLTENELAFYKKLKIIAEQNNFAILSKIRLADLIKINEELNPKEQENYLYKILYKHIDFALCDKDTLKPIIFIELQDKSHEQEERKESDRFKKTVLEHCGYQILFTYNTDNIEDEINILLKNSTPL